MNKLGIYLVTVKRGGEDATLYLTVASSANQAADTVFTTAVGEPDLGVTEIGDVGRLGDYEPGIEGHRMVVSRPNSAYIMREAL